jgi:putative ABC transport system permease protein
VTKAAIGSQYFRAMGIRLLEGRDFADTDAAHADRVVIVSGSVASRIWPGENAIGRRLSLETGSGPRTWLTIVGVVDDVRQGGVKSAFAPAVYQPYGQVTRPSRLTHMTFVVRTDDHPERLAPMMRGALRAIDRDQAPQSVVAMDDVLGHAIAEPRFQSRLLGVFSLVAVILAAIGIYGVLAASVAERSREIGIRLALGADRGSVVRMVLGRTLALTGAGILLGLIGALLTTQVLTRLLFNVTPTDPRTLAAAAAALVAVSLVAGVLPARRATLLDPLIALRTE